jgi:hypothetical protein
VRPRLALAFAALTGALALGLACTDRLAHGWAAWQYDIQHDCLLTPAVVDVLSGPEKGTCQQVRCWESPGHEIYITNTACDAPPDYTNETNEKSGACHAALEIFGRASHGQCVVPDGGAGGGAVTSETPE